MKKLKMKMLKNKKNILFAGILVSLFSLSLSCSKTPVPRPYGYYRVDLPPHEYESFDSTALPYSFDKSTIAQIRPRLQKGEEYWIDIIYPTLNACVYCSYKPIHSDLFNLLEDTRRIVYKHTVKADAIDEKLYENTGKHTYGIFYDLAGNTASQIQFVLTDSVHHFFRAALYFENVPNKDSIAPMAAYIKQDMIRMMESFEWKK
ncbi:MAG: gliding motility lipoprotein GldD [Paludibacteraceae bacterium]